MESHDRIATVSRLISTENVWKSGNDYAQSQPRVNQERLKKCFIWEPKLFQPKLVLVETVDPDRTRPEICAFPSPISDLIPKIRYPILDLPKNTLVPRACDLFGQRWDRKALVSAIAGCREFHDIQ